MSLSFTKTERNFRSGSSVCKQTQELQGEGRKTERAGAASAHSYTHTHEFQIKSVAIIRLQRKSATMRCAFFNMLEVLIHLELFEPL